MSKKEKEKSRNMYYNSYDRQWPPIINENKLVLIEIKRKRLEYTLNNNKNNQQDGRKEKNA